MGFLAQEVEDVFPELVITDTAGYKNLDYSKLTAVLASAIQEQQGEIEEVSLKTDSNVTSLSGLQSSVDEELLTVSGILTEQVEVNDFQDESLQVLSSDFNTLDNEVSALADSVETMAEQLAVLTDFFTTFDLGNVLTLDGDRNVEIEGMFVAQSVRADEGRFTLLTIESKEDGSAVTGRGELERGTTQVTIETTAVEEESNILVTPRAAFDGSLAVTAIEEGESFTVEIHAPLDMNLPFTWWIVGHAGNE